MKCQSYNAASEQETERLGAVLADVLPPGTVIALIGTLGAGKTRLVQAVAEALNVDARDIVSPTFVLIQEYQGDKPVYHFDAYRLRDEDEFLELGPEEYFDGDGLSLIEWADRVDGCLPGDRLEVAIEVTGPDSRAFELRFFGEELGQACDELSRRLSLVE